MIWWYSNVAEVIIETFSGKKKGGLLRLQKDKDGFRSCDVRALNIVAVP